MKEGDKFNFFVPMEYDNIFKAEEKTGEEKYDNMLLEGEASDNSRDADGQSLEPNGYVTERFLTSGLLNYEHLQNKEGSKFLIGEPFDAYVKEHRFFIKGKLWKYSQVARDLWDTLITMKKSGSTRRPGWSIEGKILKTDPTDKTHILKSLITHAAITFTPKNYNSWATICKGGYEKAYIEPEFDETANGGAEYLLDITHPDGTRITIDKEFNTKVVTKAVTVGSSTGMDLVGKETSGASLKRESIDRKLKVLQPDFIKSVIEISKNKDKFSKEQFKKISKRIGNLLMN